jgi:hypothetical protein
MVDAFDPVRPRVEKGRSCRQSRTRHGRRRSSDVEPNTIERTLVMRTAGLWPGRPVSVRPVQHSRCHPAEATCCIAPEEGSSSSSTATGCPARRRRTPVPGSVVVSARATGVAHVPRRRTGDRFAHGTREAAGSCYYPRSNKILFRGASASSSARRRYWGGGGSAPSSPRRLRNHDPAR